MHTIFNHVFALAGRAGRRYYFRGFAVALFATLASCATTSGPSMMRPGMSTAEIERLMGQPDEIREAGRQVAYTYRDRWTIGMTMGRYGGDKWDGVFLFEDDRLIKHGPGEVLRPEPRATSLSIVWTPRR